MNSLKKYITIIACAVLLLLPLPAYNLLWLEAFNSGHTIIFLVVSLAIYSQLTEKIPSLNFQKASLLVFVSGLMFGLVMEAVQGLVGRDASWDDLSKNLFGLMAGLVLISAFCQKKSISHKKQLFYILVACGFVLLGILPLLQLSGDYLRRANAFPVIVDFNAKWSGSFVRFHGVEVEVSSDKVDDGDAMFHFDSGRYPGVSIIEPVPDWSAYKRLRFRIVSGRDENTVLSLRVHDKNHNNNHPDRFNQKLIIHPGINDIAIPLTDIKKGPLNRELDLTNIAGLIIFMSKAEKSQWFEISNIYLD